MQGDVNLYKGVGKMHVVHFDGVPAAELSDPHIRFMMMPRKAMEDELKTNAKELTDDINSLNKKVNIFSLSIVRSADGFGVILPV